MSDIESIRNDLKIESFEKLTNEQMSNLLQMAGKGKISVQQLEQIATMVPSFFASVVEGLHQVSASAASSQDKALSGLKYAIESLERLTAHPQADKETIQLVAEKIIEVAKLIDNANESNNSFFGNAGGWFKAIAVGFVALIGLALAADN